MVRSVFKDESFTLYQGNNVEVLGEVAEQIDCVVTSPPYWGQRDYGTGYWEGGDAVCTHASARRKTRYDYSLASSPIQDGTRKGTDAQPALFAETCPDCGAERVDDQIGLEKSIDDYLEKLVQVFTAALHLYAPATTIWVNLGDKYMDRQLCLVPARFALAMKNAGFKLLADIIWDKPDPQPFSVKHRPSTSHEYIYMFAISKENYYGYDDVKEPMASSSIGRMKSPRLGANNKGNTGNYAIVNPDFSDAEKNGYRNMRTVWRMATETFPGAHYAVYPEELVRRCLLAGCPPGGTVLDPFVGSGTTAVVARRLRRKCIGIDLSANYCKDAIRRYQGRDLVKESLGQISLMEV